MKTISTINHKGGTGKTTSSLNIGAALAHKGYKVLLIDLDPQANLTSALGFAIDNISLYNSFVNNAPLEIVHKDNFHLVQGSLKTADAEAELINVMAREGKLSKLLNAVKNDYDFCIIDCPPSLNILTINSMTASDYILIPVNAQFFSKLAIESIAKIFNSIKADLNENLQILGMFVTSFNSTRKVECAIIDSLRDDYEGFVFDTTIRVNVSLTESVVPPNSCDVHTYDETSNGSIDYKRLTDEILQRIN